MLCKLLVLKERKEDALLLIRSWSRAISSAVTGNHLLQSKKTKQGHVSACNLAQVKSILFLDLRNLIVTVVTFLYMVYTPSTGTYLLGCTVLFEVCICLCMCMYRLYCMHNICMTFGQLYFFLNAFNIYPYKR